MSHTIEREANVKNATSIERVCAESRGKFTYLGWKKNIKLFDGRRATGHAVQAKGWKYPIIFDAVGKAIYDDYNGQWGNVEDLDAFTQKYGVAETVDFHEQKGHKVDINYLENGEIEVLATVGGPNYDTGGDSGGGGYGCAPPTED